jgi:hypothetical protein
VPAAVSSAANPAAPDGSTTCFCTLHQEQDRPRDRLVGDGHYLVDVGRDVGQRQLPRRLDRDPVGDGRDLGQRHRVPGRQRCRERGRPRRLHADDADVRPQRLGRDGGARDQPPAADGHHDGRGIGNLLDDLKAHRALARDDIGMVKRVHEHSIVLSRPFLRRLERIVEGLTDQPHLGTIRTRRFDLGQRRRDRHEHRRPHAQQRRGQGDALRVVAGAGAHDPPRPLLGSQLGDAVVSASDLERARSLQMLALEHRGVATARRHGTGDLHRRALRHPCQALTRGVDVIDTYY